MVLVCLDRQRSGELDLTAVFAATGRLGVALATRGEGRGATGEEDQEREYLAIGRPVMPSLAAALGQFHQVAQRSLLFLARVTFQVAIQKIVPDTDFHCARAGR